MVEKEFVSKKLANHIKEKRDTKGWSQEKLAHEADFSPAMISRLEQGSLEFNKKKLMKVCSILDIDIEKVNEEPFIESSYSIIEDLKIIETELKEDPKTAMEQLRQIEQIYKHLGEDIPLLAVYGSYLKGKYYNSKGAFEEARSHFEKAIQIGECYLELKETNLISACYYRLSRIMNQQNLIHKALNYANQGIKSFVQGGGRAYTYYLLYIIKASILEKMKDYGQALSIVEKLWQERSFLMFSDCRLNLYQLKVELFNRTGRYTEAIQVGQEGLEFARLENNPDRKFELLSSLGEAHTRLGNLRTAERYYGLAQKLEGKIKNKSLAITTYTNLGEIYLQQNNLDDAEKILKAVEKLDGKQDEYRLCQALLLLGEVYQRQKKNKKALQILEQSLELSNKLSIDQFREHTLVLLTAIAFHSKLPELEKYIASLLQMHYTRNKTGGGGDMFHNDPPED